MVDPLSGGISHKMPGCLVPSSCLWLSVEWEGKDPVGSTNANRFTKVDPGTART